MHNSLTNLQEINEEINSKNIENNKAVKIIAVSKTFPKEDILPLINHGHIDFGENKVQEAIEKWGDIKNDFPNIKLHMIGKLQSNKVKFAVSLFDYIHSLDNQKLAEKISLEQKKLNKELKIFIQINIGNEDQKSGINPNYLKSFYEMCTEKLSLNIIGIMCLPPNDKKSSLYFEEMNKLKSTLNVNELSMGMSSDYLEAAEHGASYIRIGSKIFGKRS